MLFSHSLAVTHKLNRIIVQLLLLLLGRRSTDEPDTEHSRRVDLHALAVAICGERVDDDNENGRQEGAESSVHEGEHEVVLVDLVAEQVHVLVQSTEQEVRVVVADGFEAGEQKDPAVEDHRGQDRSDGHVPRK